MRPFKTNPPKIIPNIFTYGTTKIITRKNGKSANFKKEIIFTIGINAIIGFFPIFL